MPDTVPGSVEARAKTIRVDGEPRLMLAGEVHYFRLSKEDWAPRLAQLVASGCDTVASYVPWLWHELPDGSIDLAGRTRAERDLGAFVDLAAEHGLWFVARPGPFVMAELRNEGLPYRLAAEHPEILPVGWDGRPAPTQTVDYLAPAFLAETRRWYTAVGAVLAPRMRPAGGNVVAVQLDNEIGMLAWISNSPDLTPLAVGELAEWIGATYGEAARSRYPVDLADPATAAAAFRSPSEDWAGALRQDLGLFTRERFARYVGILRDYAEDAGMRGVPFLINIAGSDAGRARDFALGISQLSRSYAGVPGVLAGTDLYLDELNPAVATDLYVTNVFCDAVLDADQPTTALEFEAGTGDHSEDLGKLHGPSDVDLRSRLCVAQGNKLINYYLFAGGVNAPLDEPVGDGQDRISFTGERHGFAAPVGPEGGTGPAYEALRGVVSTLRANAGWLASMRPEHDDVALGLVLDQFMTEYVAPNSAVMRAVADDLRFNRGAGPHDVLARSLLASGYRFGAVDLQGRVRDGAAVGASVVCLGGTAHLDEPVQRLLLSYVRDGGGLLLVGALPTHDFSGAPCTVLADGLGLRVTGARRGGPGSFPSVRSVGWAAPRAEFRVDRMHLLAAPDDAEVLLRDAASGSPVGVEVSCGAGRAVVVTADIPAYPSFVDAAVRRLGGHRRLAHDTDVPWLLALTMADDRGARMLHLLNVTGYPNRATLTYDGEKLLGGRELALPGRSALLLPLGCPVPGGTIAWSTAEVSGVAGTTLTFRGTQAEDVVVLDVGTAEVTASGATVTRDGASTVVTSTGGPAAFTVTIG